MITYLLNIKGMKKTKLNIYLLNITRMECSPENRCPASSLFKKKKYDKQENVSIEHRCPGRQMDWRTNRQTDIYMVICVMFHNDRTLLDYKLAWSKTLNWAEWTNRQTNGRTNRRLQLQSYILFLTMVCWWFYVWSFINIWHKLH